MTTGPLPALPPRDKAEREAIATAQALENSLDQLTLMIASIIKWKQTVLRTAVASVIVAVLTLGTLGWFAWENSQASQRIRVTQLRSCELGNQLRAKEDGVWHQFIAIATAGKPQSPDSQRIITKLFVYIDGTFTQVNC